MPIFCRTVDKPAPTINLPDEMIGSGEGVVVLGGRGWVGGYGMYSLLIFVYLGWCLLDPFTPVFISSLCSPLLKFLYGPLLTTSIFLSLLEIITIVGIY